MRRHLKRPQFLNTPAMLGDPSGHRGRALETPPARRRPRHPQALMWRAAMRDGPAQVHAVPPRVGLSCQGSAPACQRREPRATRRVEGLAGGRVADPVAWRSAPARLDLCGRPVPDAAFDLDHSALRSALDDRRHADPLPGATPWTPALSGAHHVAACRAHGTDVGSQPIGTAPERAVQGTRAHPCEQAPDQGEVTRRTHLPSAPQPGPDHHRQCQPHDATRCLDPDRIGLHVPQVPGLLNQIRWPRPARLARPGPPRRHRPLVAPQGHDDRVQRTPMGQERDHAGHRLGRGPQAVPCRAFRRGTRLPALQATEPPGLARMETKMALACLASREAIQMRAECRCGVPDSPPGCARIDTKKSRSGPRVSLQTNLTTV